MAVAAGWRKTPYRDLRRHHARKNAAVIQSLY
jgi:hypothetical protein